MISPTKKISAKPEAELAPRRDDQLLSSEELQQFELFGELKKAISVEKFPGSIVLRKFRQGDTICRQGDRGHSAFYVASAADMQRLEALRSGNEPPAAAAEEPPERRRVATAFLTGSTQVARTSLLGRWLPGRARRAERADPASIPNDGPTDIDYATRQAPMVEGDVFGEMSCMTLAPRSATIVVDEDCHMIEFLRNIFDKVQSDAGYRKRADEVYAQRVLSTHLGRLEIFRGLTPAQLATLRDAAQLEVVEPGAVICDEGDLSDSVYLIRSGVVQVVRGAHVALREADVTDWQAFCQALVAAADGPGDESTEPASSPGAARPASGPATKSKGSVADILAAARGSKPPAKPADATPSEAGAKSQDRARSEARTKPKRSAAAGKSAADILAAARGGAKTGSAGQAKRSAAPATGRPGSDDQDAPMPLSMSPPASVGKPAALVWNWFAPHVQAAVRSIAAGKETEDARKLVISAINQLIRRRDFVTSPDVATVLTQREVAHVWSTFPQGLSGTKKLWSELEVRVAGVAALRAIFPAALRRQTLYQGPPDILSYLSRGDCFGEMAVVLDAPRQATCIAYDHPSDDSKRKPGRVELVRIEGAAFKSLLGSSDMLRARVDQLVQERYGDIVAGELRPAGEDEPLSHSQAYRDEGLAQGQSLLLIDLDRCTRCGDCVRACQQTHDDGYSRLYLDGPKFDRFLIPSACRKCLNPACMIGCPVGSIQRGDNGQIEIRDWCIGCKLCADQCPYDSIQMHDLGIIPDETVGWQFAPASAVAGRNWQAARFRGRGWAAGAAPFQWTLDLVEQLASYSATAWQAEPGSAAEPICFRYPFHLSRRQLGPGAFHLHISSTGFEVRAWLNGRSISAEPPANPKKKPRLDELQARLDAGELRRGSNLLAVQVSPPEPPDGGGQFVPKYNQLVLSARLDALPQAGELATATAGERFDLEVEMVKRRAVVCDLCSSLASQRPACVDQCPHEAAIRVNAQSEFPSPGR